MPCGNAVTLCTSATIKFGTVSEPANPTGQPEWFSFLEQLCIACWPLFVFQEKNEVTIPCVARMLRNVCPECTKLSLIQTLRAMDNSEKNPAGATAKEIPQ